MTDEKLKAAFRQLDAVEPSPGFLLAVRSIPLRHPREEKGKALSLWEIFRLPSRVATLALSTFCGLGVGYLTVEHASQPADGELTAFLNVDADDALFAASADVDWDAP